MEVFMRRKSGKNGSGDSGPVQKGGWLLAFLPWPLSALLVSFVSMD
jgi:hypothetical protein